VSGLATAEKSNSKATQKKPGFGEHEKQAIKNFKITILCCKDALSVVSFQPKSLYLGGVL